MTRLRQEATPGQARDRFFHYVNFHRIEDFLRCGWVVVIPRGLPVLSDLYGVSMEWLCSCPMVRPGEFGRDIAATSSLLRPKKHVLYSAEDYPL